MEATFSQLGQKQNTKNVEQKIPCKREKTILNETKMSYYNGLTDFAASKIVFCQPDLLSTSLGNIFFGNFFFFFSFLS